VVGEKAHLHSDLGRDAFKTLSGDIYFLWPVMCELRRRRKKMEKWNYFENI